MNSQIITRPFNPQNYQALLDGGYDPLISRLFAARHVQGTDDSDLAINHLLHFESLMGIDSTVKRLLQARQKQEKIMVVADYDADGATACAVAIRGLRAMGYVADFLVPNRFNNGYGISTMLVDDAIAEGASLIITVDNGISAHEAIAYAQQNNVDVLVTDHHLPGRFVPDCPIVNPNQHGCTFASKSLAGVGVIFYVLMALRSALRQQGEETPKLAQWLDLVALGTIADVVKLDHNNRILVAQGLKRIQDGKMCAGIRALFAVAQRDFRYARSFDLGFFIAPRINAAGRMDDMTLGVHCLLADSDEEAMHYAQSLDSFNRDRRAIEQTMLQEALTLPQVHCADEQFSLCVLGENWHEGVIGIVASRLKEQFNRPTFTFAQSEDGNLRGSGRSIPALHLRDALDWTHKKYPGLIIRFGGHAMAAGLTLRADGFTDFQKAFEEVARERLTSENLRPQLCTDGSLQAVDITLKNAKNLEAQVWGQGFDAPSFCDIFEIRQQKIVGNHHSKLWLIKEGKPFEAMLFRHTDTLPPTIRAVYRLTANRWNNQEELQLYIDYWEAA